MSRRVALTRTHDLRHAARAALVTILLPTWLALLGPPVGAHAQEGSTEVERAVDHASRLLRAGRAEEASRVLNAALVEHPTSVAALSLLFDVTGELGDSEIFLAAVATAGRLAGTEHSAIQELWVRGLLRAGRDDQARTVAEHWLGERDDEPRAWAALASVDTATARPSRAIETLERGRRRVGDPTLFRDRLASLYAETGRYEALADEWVARLTERPPDLAAVHREAAELEAPDAALARLRSTASETRYGPDTPHAVALLSLRLGRPEPARHMMTVALSSFSPDEAPVALAAYLREAEQADLSREAVWAAQGLADAARSNRERWRWLALVGARALEAADTASALRAARTIAAQAPPGSGAHIVAHEQLVTLLAVQPSGISEASRWLDEYARAHPDSIGRIAVLTLAVSRGHQRAGNPETARSLLVAAPRRDGAARGALDAALAVLELQEGRVAEAHRLLRQVAVSEGVSQDQRTRWISLLAAIETADSSEVTRLGETLAAAAKARAFDPRAALAEWIRTPPAKGRAAALASLADELEVMGQAEAVILVHQAVVEYEPESPEAAAAMLALARREPEPAVSRAWLENLVTRFPDSAVAPLARRMLAEMSGRAPAGG